MWAIRKGATHMAARNLPSSETHIRDAHRWARTIIAIAFLALAAGFIGELSTVKTTPAREGAGLAASSRP
jgi:hypothetical protein